MLIRCTFATHDGVSHRGLLHDFGLDPGLDLGLDFSLDFGHGSDLDPDDPDRLGLACPDDCHGRNFSLSDIARIELLEDSLWTVETDPVDALKERGVGVQWAVANRVWEQVKHLDIEVQIYVRGYDAELDDDDDDDEDDDDDDALY